MKVLTNFSLLVADIMFNSKNDYFIRYICFVFKHFNYYILVVIIELN